MSKYRFKTREEFIRDELWEEKYNCPDEWSWEGKMNKYLGIDVPDELNVYCNKKEDFKYDGWYFKNHDYVLKEQQEYFDDLSQHIGRYIRALVDNPHSGFSVKKGDVGKIISYGEIDFPNHKAYNCTRALDKNNLGLKYELLPEDYSPEQEVKDSNVEFIPGKWYRLGEWISKFKKLENNNFWGYNIDTKSKFIDSSGHLSLIKYTPILITDLLEIQEYLPEGHPDKVKNFKIEVGKWYSFNWDWSGKDHIVVAKIKEISEKDFIISWRSYLWKDKDYNNEDGYMFKDISNIKELSIEEVQPYLPNGHPDKIINQKFEIGKWYKWYQKNHGKYHFGKVERINTETDTVVMLPWIIGCTDYNYSGYFDLSKAEQIQEISVEEVQEFLPKKHSDKISSDVFKKGEYIVLIGDGQSTGGARLVQSDQFIKNHCYKVRENSTFLRTELDSNGSTTNGWECVPYNPNQFHKTRNWRYASEKESIEYERRGKPYDVTELNKQFLLEENVTEIPEYVECVNYFGDKYTGKIYNTKLDKPEKISTNTWYGILIDCGRLKDGSFKISNKEAYKKQKNWLGNSEESISKFAPILNPYEGTIANISVCDAIMQYPSISANYWKEIPKLVEQEFDIYGPTPDIN